MRCKGIQVSKGVGLLRAAPSKLEWFSCGRKQHYSANLWYTKLHVYQLMTEKLKWSRLIILSTEAAEATFDRLGHISTVIKGRSKF